MAIYVVIEMSTVPVPPTVAALIHVAIATAATVELAAAYKTLTQMTKGSK